MVTIGIVLILLYINFGMVDSPDAIHLETLKGNGSHNVESMALCRGIGIWK